MKPRVDDSVTQYVLTPCIVDRDCKFQEFLRDKASPDKEFVLLPGAHRGAPGCCLNPDKVLEMLAGA